jgi:signal peptidase I
VRRITVRSAPVIGVLVGLAGAGIILVATGRPYYLVSGSMEPAFHAGDLFWLRPTGSVVRPGTVVTFRMGEAIITHRVITVEGETLTTQGDGNGEVDPWPVPRTAVLGTPAFRLPYAGWIVDLVRRSAGLGLSALLGALLVHRVCRRRRWLTRARAGEGPTRRGGDLLAGGEGLASWRSTALGRIRPSAAFFSKPDPSWRLPPIFPAPASHGRP